MVYAPSYNPQSLLASITPQNAISIASAGLNNQIKRQTLDQNRVKHDQLIADRKSELAAKKQAALLASQKTFLTDLQNLAQSKGLRPEHVEAIYQARKGALGFEANTLQDAILGSGTQPEYKAPKFGQAVKTDGGFVQFADDGSTARHDDISPYEAPVKPTSDIQNFEYGLANPEFASHQERLKKAGASNVNVSTTTNNNPIPPTSKTTNDLQTGYVNAQKSLSRLHNISKNVQDKYLTYDAKPKSFLGGVSDKMGLDNAYAKFNAERAAGLMDVKQAFNQYRKEITGAAASEQELKMLEDAFINDGQGPLEFEAVLNTLIEGALREAGLSMSVLQSNDLQTMGQINREQSSDEQDILNKYGIE